MTRHRPLLSSLCAATLVAGFAGCAPEGGDKVVLITNNVAAPVDTCVLTVSEAGPFRSSGIVDVLFPGAYFMLPQIENLATSNDGTLISNRTFFAEGFRVVLSSPDAATHAVIGSLSYSIPKGFTVAPDGGGFIASLRLLEPSVIELIAPTIPPNRPAIVIASVELIGNMGGDQVTSNKFEYPIEFCVGCLIRDLGPCDQLDPAFTLTIKGNACNPGQDDAVQCCTVPGNYVCPAIGTKQP